MVSNHARKLAHSREQRLGGGSRREAAARLRAATFIPTGLTGLDRRLGGGLRRRKLTVLAARTGMGKSMLALAFARHAAIRLRRVALVASLEMSHYELACRVLAAESGVPTEKLQRASFDDTEQVTVARTASVLQSAPLHFGGDTASPGLADIQALHVRRGAKADLLVVDYLGLMDTFGSTTRERGVAAILDGLSHLAEEENLAVVVVEQLDRALLERDDRRPRPTDMVHAEQIMPRVGTTILLYRPAFFAPRHRQGRYERSPDPKLYPENFFPRLGLPEPTRQPAQIYVSRHRDRRFRAMEVEVDLSRSQFSEPPADKASAGR
ncbi:DnaB-like helicase C-terminal domain-containing protein [Streptomyces diastaticus]|uniref:DnaB-like helicase C-terminal domain-containing protein n=1 Tax=Streptomyces diastaticus TaxID=1956 RepID=UPI0037D11189